MSIESKMVKMAQQKVLASTTWLSTLELAKRAKVSTICMQHKLSEWKFNNEIFGVLIQTSELFPDYIFDLKKVKPLPNVAPILALFLNKKDAWGMAYWFASANGFLGGERPQNILRVDPYRAFLAAQDEILGITHG